MGFLYFLEGIRTPFLDKLFQLITFMGEETIFLALAIIIFWCVNKKLGYYILTVGLSGTVLNQFLKIVCQVPRPWVLDPNFEIVESARAGATGYSFPSGHTQSSVGLFGSIARWVSSKPVKIICISLCILIPLSRMYLGVHTPYDVGASILIATLLIFVMKPVAKNIDEKPKYMRYTLLAILLVSLSFILYVNFFSFPADIDSANLNSAIENSFKLFGAVLGLLFTFEIDSRYTRFDTKAVWWAQLLKTLLGLAIVIGIKGLLKAPLYSLIGIYGLADAIRYFIVVAFAGTVWPLSFKYFARLGNKK